MQKNSYFPSPLRKDYTSKPVHNFVPIIVKQASQASVVQRQQKTIQQKIKYSDGLLVKLYSDYNTECGLFFMKNYACVIYNLFNNKPNGQIYVMYLSGVVLQANYQNGVLHGWVISLLQNKFIACNFYNKGIKDHFQHFYDVKQKLIIVSEYKKGKLVEIKNGQYGQFHQIINKKQLSDKVLSLQQRNLKISSKFPKNKFQNLQYYGEFNQKNNTPHGYGIILSQMQIFMGNFHLGCLNGIGGIKFQNGQFYYGQFNNGSCEGYGSIHMCNRVVYKFDNQQIDKNQFDRFIQLQFGASRDKWLSKFSGLQVFHEQFKSSYSEQIQQNNQSQQPYIQQSSFKLQVEDNDSNNYSFSSQKSNNKNIQVPINNKKNAKVPKISLFQQMKLHQSQQNKNLTRRNEQKTNEQYNKRILTQRKQDPKIKLIQVNFQQRDFKKSRNQISKSDQKFSKYGSVTKQIQNQIQAEDLTLDKYHVACQYSFMRPNQMQTKQKINKFTQLKLQKNSRSPQINMGKILKVPSEVPESHQDDFLQRIQKQ